jgi:hypothetical protein
MPREAQEPPRPVCPRVLIKDATIEKVAELLADLPKGLLLHRDEFQAFIGGFDRYSGGRGGADRASWLEAWGGRSKIVDRSKNPAPIHVPYFGISLAGTIQPDRLREVTSGPNDGFVVRFLWAWPDPVPFRRPRRAAEIDAITSALRYLASLDLTLGPDGRKVPVVLPFDDGAAATIEEFAREMQAREGDAAGLMKSALGKARGHALRLAVVLEHLWWSVDAPATPPPSLVSTRAAQAACGLMDDYFLPMAARVYGDVGLTTEQRNARTLARHIAKVRPKLINEREIRETRGLPGLTRAKAVKEAVAELVAEDVLLPVESAGGPGRPRGDYRVNPRLWELLP